MKLSLIYIAVALMPSLLQAVLANDIRSIISLNDGMISGTPRDANGVIAFKGIPFAKPPVGDLRWRSPKLPTPWTGVFNASQFGHMCWQAFIAAPIFVPQSEDCLTVNIWTAAQKADEKRPVMFWIHGGGFQFGASATPLFNGQVFALEGVVLVSFNYRLGVFGFLGDVELDGEGHKSGDFGIQDMLAALRWTKENIAAFGGDPENVTVFGESAGAHAIGPLMASPLSRGLFHRAIMESGAWWDRNHGSLTTFAEARQKGLAFKKKLGVATIADLRKVSALDINNAQPYVIQQDPGVTGFAPSVDGYVVPVAPGRAFHNGQQMKIPLLAGWNEQEEYPFLGLALPHATSAQFESDAKVLFGERIPKFLSLYPDNTPLLLNQSSGVLIGDMLIREQTWEAADTHHLTSDMPVYVYYFNYTSAYSPIPSHTAEEPFVFGILINNPVIGSINPPGYQDQAFSKIVMTYWTNFAKYGNPNTGATHVPLWPEYGSGCADILNLGNTIAPIHYNLERFRFIRSFRTNGVLPISWRLLNVSTSGY